MNWLHILVIYAAGWAVWSLVIGFFFWHISEPGHIVLGFLWPVWLGLAALFAPFVGLFLLARCLSCKLEDRQNARNRKPQNDTLYPDNEHYGCGEKEEK